MSHRRTQWSSAVLLAPLFVATLAVAQTPTTKPARSADPPDKPAVKRGSNGEPDSSFIKQHEAILATKDKDKIGLLFIGDSITANWRKSRDIWDGAFGQYHPANFGIGGDACQHILWRIDQGELDGLHPKTVVVLVGGNNHRSPAPILLGGIKAVLKSVNTRLPDSKVLLLGILPRGADPTDKHDKKTGDVAAVRANNAVVNAELAKLDDGNRLRFLDVGDIFLDAKGFIPPELMADALHPTPKAYALVAERMRPVLVEMMK